MVLKYITDIMNFIYEIPVKNIILVMGLILSPLFILSSIFAFIGFPIIFNYFIVPEIELKTGKKLGYSPLLSLAPFGRFIDRHIEISRYIKHIYKLKEKTNYRGVPEGYNLFALKQIGYTIDMVSKKEIIFSYLVGINFYVLIVSLLACALAGMYVN